MDSTQPAPDMGPRMPGPAAPEVELERVTISPWYRAVIGNNDPLYGRFERGDFEVPMAGPQPGLPALTGSRSRPRRTARSRLWLK